MEKEDYLRAVSAAKGIHEDDKAAITLALRKDGGLFVSHTGGDCMELLERYVMYLGEVLKEKEGGFE